MWLVRGSRVASVAMAAGVALTCTWIAAGAAMGDYAHELRPAVSALLAGDLGTFAALAPVYAGSVWPRLPLVLPVHLAGGGDLAVYRAGALACMLAAGALAVLLERRMREQGSPFAARAALVSVVLAAPAALRVFRDGHPEDVLAGAAAVAAVLLAIRDRPALAGAALGLAVAGKPWAVLAAPAALAAAPGRRAALVAAATATAALLALPLVLSGAGRAGGHAVVLTQTDWIFHPQQLFWPLREVHANGGMTGPAWVSGVTRPLIVGLALLLAAMWASRRRRTGAAPEDALLLLALVLLLRCVLDPWNNAYYAVPAILALAGWEALTRRGLPVLAIFTTAMTWLSFVRLPGAVSQDVLAALYLAWVLPLAGAMAWRLAAGPDGPPAVQARSSATAARTAPGATSAP